LGVPGLINAYKTASVQALDSVPVTKEQVLISYTLEFDYTMMNAVLKIVKQTGCKVEEQGSELFCKMKIGIPVNSTEEVLTKFADLQTVLAKKQN
jgi:putative IMPACT (imprinted ancient) family translation regulator